MISIILFKVEQSQKLNKCIVILSTYPKIFINTRLMWTRLPQRWCTLSCIFIKFQLKVGLQPISYQVNRLLKSHWKAQIPVIMHRKMAARILSLPKTPMASALSIPRDLLVQELKQLRPKKDRVFQLCKLTKKRYKLVIKARAQTSTLPTFTNTTKNRDS